MKKLILPLLIILSMGKVKACEICGCSSGNYFIGPYPQFNRHFIGLRYSFRSFKTVLNSDQSQYSNDFYQTVELLAGTNIDPRWQILVFAPYNINHSESDDGVSHVNGLGDITVFGNYNLFDNKSLNKDTNTVAQQFWIGGGIKIPTGKFEVDTSEVVTSANSQPGSGSFDFIINSTYILQFGNWGVNSNASYKFNGIAQNFEFGDRLTANAFLFYSIHTPQFTLSPNAGLLYENLAANTNGRQKVADTGGTVLLGATGVEIRINKIMVGMNAQLPVYSNLSTGQTNAKIRGMIHLSLIL